MQVVRNEMGKNSIIHFVPVGHIASLLTPWNGELLKC